MARKLGRTIAFEASVAGGIPIITNISQCLSANGILSLEGILNGTSNFILTQMDRHKTAYADAVKEAQRLGYAEADPTMDVDGTDAAQKLAILAHLAFGASIDWREIPRVGIDRLEIDDLKYASELVIRSNCCRSQVGRRVDAGCACVADAGQTTNAACRSSRRLQRCACRRRCRRTCVFTVRVPARCQPRLLW